MTRLEETRTAWNAEAPSFDDEPDHGLRDPETRAAWRRLLLDVLPAAPARIADLGCGTGSLSVLLATEGYTLHGVDLSDRMLALARAKASAARLPVRFSEGDAGDPLLDPGGFDVVLCRHVLWALPDPGAALDRWIALLRPGGRLVLVEGSWHTGGGLPSATTVGLLRERREHVDLAPLPDPAYWGGPITDERYLVISRG